MSFVALHNNSIYTLLGSALTLDKIVDHSKEYASLTDYNSLSGAVRFFNKCKAKNIKPILGADFYIDDILFTFIIKNENGYKQLLNISALYNKNQLTLTSLKNTTSDLAVIISSSESKLIDKFNELKDTKFAYYLKQINDVVNDLYIGLEIYNEKDKERIKQLRYFLINRNYNVLAFPLIRYEKKEDEISYVLLQAIKNDEHLDENIKSATGKYYFRSEEEIENLYEQEEIDNTSRLANSIDFKLIKKRGKLIKYCESADETLKKVAYEMLEKKVTINETYKKRLDYELEVIKEMGYSDYFLIVMDYVKFAKDNGIYVGAGRGSAGGSLVAFALDIITINPLENNLLFERFLNKGRKSMPDIDVDFEDTRRDEVVNYIRNKYGKNKVGNIITSQTIKAKQAIRDIGRIYQIRASYIDTLCKALGENEDLHEAYKTSQTFRNVVNSDKYYLSIVTLASKIEGVPRQAGMHAAGVIINDEELELSLPIYIDGLGNYISQFEKDDLETLGYLKMDILGLRNLSIIKTALNEINKDKKILDYKTLPYEDNDAIKLIASGQTLGLFQLESKGMIRTIKDFNPTTFEDIVTILSLYRPGPMKFIPEYIARKNGKKKVTYPSNKLIDILKPTYGIIVYQEQIMQIAETMAGFSLSEADSFRRAISKKDASKLLAIEKSFIDGSIKNGNNKEEGKKVFDTIYRFANYGFNRSHSFAYAKLASQMSYIKYHYPAIFYAAVLDNGNHFNSVVAEIRNRNLNICLPDINRATYRYKADGNDLIVPLISIKGILSQQVMSIIKEREDNGLYKDFIDFVVRAYKNKVTPTTILKLIDAGSLDSFKYTRASLREALDRVFNYAKLLLKEDGQILLQDSFIPAPKINDIKDDDVYNINKEEESLGMTISKSPLDFYKELIKKENAIKVSEIKDQFNVKVIGIIKSIRRIKTKKDGKSMCFITLSDNIKDITVTVFADTYTKYESDLFDAKIIIVSGRFDKIRGEIIANTIKTV